MWPLLLPSRACATSWTPAVALVRTQKRVVLSTIGRGSTLLSSENWPIEFARRMPYVPVWAARPVADATPVPCAPFQLARLPVSKPSENSTVLGPVKAGVIAALALEFAPVPTELIAATRKVYAVPLVSPVTVLLVAAVLVTIAVWAVVPMNGVT